MFNSLVHSLHATTPAVSRSCWRIAPAMLLRDLPALGCVLYLPMRSRIPPVRELPRGLLVESTQLAPLLQVRWLVAASAITSEGPREWIECIDRHGNLHARLYLLPDTDYLAWDALLASGVPAMAPMPPVRWPRCLRPASAQLLRFRLRQLAGLSVFGAEVPGQISVLSRHLAGQLAGAEALPLRLTPDG